MGLSEPHGLWSSCGPAVAVSTEGLRIQQWLSLVLEPQGIPRELLVCSLCQIPEEIGSNARGGMPHHENK